VKRSVLAAMVTLPISLGTCTWLAKTSADAVRPVVRDDVGAALTRAAAAAAGQRLLVIVAKPGAAPAGAIYDSSEVPGGWGAFAPTADPADPLLPALGALAKAAAEDFARDARFSDPTVRALPLFGVAVVLVSDGTNVLLPAVGERDPNLGIAAEVPALRVRHAEPVFQFLAEELSIAPADPIGFARSLRKGDAAFRDFDDHWTWGGDVVVEADGPSQFLLSWPAHGARVSVDGAPGEFRAARVPMLVVSTPAGRHEISVRYGEERSGRQWLVIAAALVAVASAVALWLGLRPQVEPGEGEGEGA
jgi:hypothetical protein